MIREVVSWVVCFVGTGAEHFALITPAQINWNDYMADDVLDYGVTILLLLVMLWGSTRICIAIIESVVAMERRLRRANLGELARQNERLKEYLAEAQEENQGLREETLRLEAEVSLLRRTAA